MFCFFWYNPSTITKAVKPVSAAPKGDHMLALKPSKPQLLLPLIFLLLLPLVPNGAPAAQAQPLNEFFEIYSPDPVAYDMYQLKFTYLGPQAKNVPSLAVAGAGRMFDLVMFLPWQIDYDYSNDLVMGDILSVPGFEWQHFMDMINGDPALQSTQRIPGPVCSLMIQTDTPMPMCWEHVATREETDILFQHLEDSVFDPAMKETIARFRRQMSGVRR